MNDYIQRFHQKLIGIFETKAQEFIRHSQEHPNTAAVTSELAGLYADLVEVMQK